MMCRRDCLSSLAVAFLLCPQGKQKELRLAQQLILTPHTTWEEHSKCLAEGYVLWFCKSFRTDWEAFGQPKNQQGQEHTQC